MNRQRPLPPGREAPRRLPHISEGHPEIPAGTGSLKRVRAVRGTQPHRNPTGKDEPRTLTLPPPHADRTRRPGPQPLTLVEALRHNPRVPPPTHPDHHRTATPAHRPRAGSGHKRDSQKVPSGTRGRNVRAVPGAVGVDPLGDGSAQIPLTEGVRWSCGRPGPGSGRRRPPRLGGPGPIRAGGVRGTGAAPRRRRRGARCPRRGRPR